MKSETATAEKEVPKPMTRREAIEELDALIGTPAPIIEAEQLRKVIAIHGANDDAQLPPELEAAVEDVKARTKDSANKSKSHK